MSDRDYDYTPLAPHRRRRSFLWIPILIVVLLIVNIVALRKLQLPPGPLDNFQNL